AAGSSRPGLAGQPGERGGGDRRFDPNDPERRARMMERLKQMPEAERQQFLARLKERGIDLDAQPSGAGARPGQARTQEAVPAMATGGATTIDSLFGPLPTTTSVGRVWLWLSGQKQIKGPIRLRLGISDGQNTELLDGDLKEGQELVAAVQIGGSPVQGRGNSGSPLIQQRGGPPGGFRR
ncbi:MAG TPA: hypothetical protein PKK95_13650, partial [Vicinamibacterales bacterium]|nr:hypothetical protein [Vicinamibacterales bacterium]